MLKHGPIRTSGIAIVMEATAIRKFLLVLMVCNAHAVISSSLNGNETDRMSLLEFKRAVILDPQQALMSWNESTHFCNWEGVQCRAKAPRRVISLVLENQGLVGQISPSLGNLTLLNYLSVSTNRFSGEIPTSLGQLHRLQTLYLSNNSLQGAIPSFSNCSSLRFLWLNNNNLVGEIPDLPQHLENLSLFHNHLTGTIPAALANITTLIRLSCATNNIQGNIPEEFAKLHMLRVLYVGINKLTGTFQESILNLSMLVGLGLAYNQLSGTIPSNLGNSLPNLLSLGLDYNFFHGHIPHSLANMSNLQYIEISSNNFSGIVPSYFGKLTDLFYLNLEMNKLQAYNKQEWEFLNNLANCTKLQILSIARNLLQGQVPNSLGNLSVQLVELYLGGNQLSSSLPSGKLNYPNLIILALDYNEFTGVLPEWLGTLSSIQELFLETNHFTGPIPSFLSNLSQVGYLYLDSNKFDGHFPVSFGSLSSLQILSISNNNLHGSIPKEIFKIPTLTQIELSFNKFDGLLPFEVGNAKQLIQLHLSSNNLSGDIPNSLGSCESLEQIKLDQNSFSRKIPTSLGNISSLKVLNFSHNNLTGPIPVSLGSLQLLEQLDLSYNNLEGGVPTKGIFKNMTAIQIAGNRKLCGGILELHLNACSIAPSKSSAKHKKIDVLKVVIPIAIMMSIGAFITIWFLRRRKRKRKSIPLPLLDTKFPKVSFNDIARATEGFSSSNLIGKGRYGSVYQGKLFQEQNLVAVKVFNLEISGAHKSFMTECNTLRNVRHRNLVPILTACSSIDSGGNNFKALVYKFMPGGDLHKLLYSSQGDEIASNLNYITLGQRLSIIVDVSEAMAYLHHNHQGCIIHCDLKPSNILLDDNMTAHVGDFGLARLQMHLPASSFGDSISTSSIAIKGTIGYVAPECASGGQVSRATDVYSFGVVLLEIFIQRRPTDDIFKDGLDIVKFTEINFPNKVWEIVDPHLLQEIDLCKETSMAVEKSRVDFLHSVLNVGLCCTRSCPEERISMKEAAAKLHGISDAYIMQRINKQCMLD